MDAKISATPVFDELDLLGDLLPESADISNLLTFAKCHNFFPSLKGKPIIEEYLKETKPRKLQIRPIKGDSNQAEAAIRYWSVVFSSLKATWPKKQQVKVMATGSLLDQSKQVRNIVQKLGGDVVVDEDLLGVGDGRPIAINLDDLLQVKLSSVDAMLLYLHRTDRLDSISFTLFDDILMQSD